MGFFSWLLGEPAGKPQPKDGAKTPGDRQALIREAMRIHGQKRKEFENLDPETRARLLRQALGKDKPGGGS